jgi:hypothetical protein
MRRRRLKQEDAPNANEAEALDAELAFATPVAERKQARSFEAEETDSPDAAEADAFSFDVELSVATPAAGHK